MSARGPRWRSLSGLMTDRTACTTPSVTSSAKTLTSRWSRSNTSAPGWPLISRGSMCAASAHPRQELRHAISTHDRLRPLGRVASAIAEHGDLGGHQLPEEIDVGLL